MDSTARLDRLRFEWTKAVVAVTGGHFRGSLSVRGAVDGRNSAKKDVAIFKKIQSLFEKVLPGILGDKNNETLVPVGTSTYFCKHLINLSVDM